MPSIVEQLDQIVFSMSSFIPEITLVLGMLLLIITDLIRSKTNFAIVIALFVLVAYATFLELQQAIDFKLKPQFLFDEMLYLDAKGSFFKLSIALFSIFICLHTFVFEQANWRKDLRQTEFYVVLIAIVLGLFIMAMAVNLISLFVAIELVSMGSYILVAFSREKNSLEAAIQYLIFGATSSAIMLYGFSMLYGMTGSMVFVGKAFQPHLLAQQPLSIFIGSFMAVGGLLFKLAAVPFHVWTPQVYEASPTPTVSFLSVLPKIAALLALMRLLEALGFAQNNALVGIIAASLLIGNFSALWQLDAKKMLAYSSIAHAGFMLVGLCATSKLGSEATTFYVVTYGFINLAAFVLLDVLSQHSGSMQLDSFAGLGRKQPILGVAAVVIALALVGLPPTVGFSGKLLIFTALWDAFQQSQDLTLFYLLIFGLVNAAISLFYYLKIPYQLFFKETDSAIPFVFTLAQKALLAALTIPIIILFFKPEWLMDVIGQLRL